MLSNMFSSAVSAPSCKLLQRRHVDHPTAICRLRHTLISAAQPSEKLDSHQIRRCCASAETNSAEVEYAASSADAAGAPGTSGDESSSSEPRISVTIKKPMGMVLKEGPGGEVVVESIVEGGHTDEDGTIQVGDVLRRCSAWVLQEGKSGEYAKKGHGARPFEDYNRITFEADGEDFKTVMAAIGSNNERWGIFDVTLELSRS